MKTKNEMVGVKDEATLIGTAGFYFIEVVADFGYSIAGGYRSGKIS